MTLVDLHRAVRDVVPPIGATGVCCVVDDAGKHRAAFVIDQRRKSPPVGPAFDRPRDAIAFSKILAGDGPTSRSAPESYSASAGGPDSQGLSEGSESPSVLDPVAGHETAAGVRTCVSCGRPLPPGSRRQRRTCSGACREALSAPLRHSAQTGPLTVSGGPSERVERSGGSSATPSEVPTSSEVPSGEQPLLLGASRDARADVSPGPRPGLPTLGL